MPYPVIILPFLKADGLTLYPFIFIREKQLLHDSTLMRHEQIHLVQQLELLLLPFYIFYLLNYLYNLARFRNHPEAYRSIIFEREAYDHETEPDYLRKRKLFAPFRAGKNQ